MSDRRRRLVAVSWSMPPALFPRSIQISRLLKGLQRAGWKSTVVTLDAESRPGTEPLDSSLEELYARHYDIERVSLNGRAPRLEPVWLRWHLDDRLPEIDRVWASHAAVAVRRALKREDPAVLMTFAQPWRDHYVPLAVTRRKVPWVAHFSDPWVDSLYYDHLTGGERALELQRERRVVQCADRVIFTNAYAADLVMRKYPAAWRRKVRIVEHAADPDLLPLADAMRMPAPATPGPLRLSYVGALLVGRRTADDVLHALAVLHERTPLTGRLAFTVVGSGSGTDDAKRKVSELGLDTVVTFTPQVSHVESLAAMRDSHALMLIDASAETNVFLPSKLVDYLAADRPILAVTPAVGLSAELVRSCRYPVVEPGDVDGLVVALEDLLRRHEKGCLKSTTPPEVLARYSLDAAAASVSAILDEAAEDFSSHKRWFVSLRAPAASRDGRRDEARRMARFAWRLLPPAARHHIYMAGIAAATTASSMRPSGRRWLRFARPVLRLAWAIASRLTLAPHRRSVSVYWPDARGVDRAAAVIALALFRLHWPVLHLVWRHIHLWRRVQRRQPMSDGGRRVLHVTSSFDLGGTQRQIKNLCTATATRFSHDTTEIFPELNYMFRQNVGIDAGRYGGGGVVGRTAARLVRHVNTRSPQLVQAYKLARDFRALAPDVVVGWGHEMCVTTFVAATFARVPRIVFCIRTLNPAYGWVRADLGRLLGGAHRRMVRHVDGVIANSSVVREDYSAWLGLPPGAIALCPNGIDVAPLSASEIAARRRSVRRELGLDDDTFVATNVGRFSMEKGQMSILRVNERLLRDYRPDALLWLLCGDGPTLAQAEAYAAEHGMTNVRFVGRTSRVAEFLCASDLFVMPSDFEGMPNAMMEAMAYSLPCVSTNRSGAIDVARADLEALFYAPGDLDLMERHIRWAIEHRDEARAMGARAQARLAEFSIAASVRRFEDILERR